jgi:hypothetical protein
MGWPRKNEGLRVYFERKEKSYLLYDPVNHEGVGEVLVDNNPQKPMLASTSVSPIYLANHCKRVQWDEMPEVWQHALQSWLSDNPKNYRGLWRMKTIGLK